MSLKFKIHGIEVVADNATEAFALLNEARKAEVAQAQAAAPRANGKPHAWPLPAAIPTAAATVTTPAPAASPTPLQFDLTSPDEAQSGSRNVDTTLRFLKAVDAHTLLGGLGTKGMLKVFGVDKPKALGSKTGVVNKVLHRLGYDHKAVYVGERGLESKVFSAGPKINEAIAACEAAISKT